MTTIIEGIVITVASSGITLLARRYWQTFLRFSRKEKLNTTELIAKRLDYLLESHYLTNTELLSLVPTEWGWNIGAVENTIHLASQMEAKHFQWFAHTFHVKQSWLKGKKKTAIDAIWNYRELKNLGEKLKHGNWIHKEMKMTILSANYEGKNSSLGKFLIVFSVPIPENKNEDTIYKHQLVEMERGWFSLGDRFDVKSLARWYSMELNQLGSIPIVPITRDDYEQLRGWKILPAQFVPERNGGFDHLEDRILLPEESLLAIECEETDAWLTHLKQSGFLEVVAMS